MGFTYSILLSPPGTLIASMVSLKDIVESMSNEALLIEVFLREGRSNWRRCNTAGQKTIERKMEPRVISWTCVEDYESLY